ncbi:MAG: response regulator [Anaerolineaceae bacterium]|nr:response regulator [Anaerolineaceae bacterium]
MNTASEYTILIVDDQPSSLEVLSELLEGHGFEVLAARDGEAAVEIAQRARPALILLDVVLPGIDGFEVCRRLKADKATERIPVIFMTILEKVEDKIQGFQLGATDYITKPFETEEVLARVTTQLRLRRLTLELQEANETLEQRVAERTAQLAQVNKELQAEVAERRAAEAALGRVNRAYRTLSESNRIVVHATEETELLEEVCQTIVTHSDYLQACVDLVEHDGAKTTRTVAQAGYALKDGYASAAVFPLVTSEQETIGALTVYAAEADAFTEEENCLFMELATDMAFGITAMRTREERKRAEEAEQQRRRIAETLVEAAAVLNSTLDLDQVLELILQQLGQAIDYDSASFLAMEGDQVVISAYHGFRQPGDVLGFRFSLNPELPTYHVVAEKAPLHLADVNQEYPRFQIKEATEPFHYIYTWLGVPVLAKDSVIGIIALDRFEVRPFTEDDIRLAAVFANQAAIAIENARLHQQTQRHAEELETRVEERTMDLQQQILERKRIEETLRERTLQLEAANEGLRVLSRVKDEFVSNVSHELRTPVTNLKLRQHLLAARPDRWEGHLAVMARETTRLEQIIESLLFLSRLDQARVDWKPTRADLNELVSQFVRDRAALAQSGDLTLSFSGEPELPLVEVDVVLWEQALSILLTNAFNYTPAGGHVEVRTEVSQRDGQRWVGVSVHDTGPGIPPDEQHHLFERFFRGAVGRKSGAPGTGLGLAIVQEIVNRHHGQVEVMSEGLPGKGTTFSLWLLAAESAEAGVSA